MQGSKTEFVVELPQFNSTVLFMIVIRNAGDTYEGTTTFVVNTINDPDGELNKKASKFVENGIKKAYTHVKKAPHLNKD